MIYFFQMHRFMFWHIIGSVCVFIAVLSLCKAELSLIDAHYIDTAWFDGYNKGRATRALTPAVAKSIATLEKLLSDASKVKSSSKHYRLYTKDGNSQTAMDDFMSLEPVPAMTDPVRRRDGFTFHRGVRSGEGVLIGNVGNKRVIFMPNGDRNSRRAPVLEIRSTTGATFDRIVYTER